MEIILVRHGQPEWVAKDRSVLNPKLTEQGREQAERLAESAALWSRPTELFVSPTRRTQETAAPLVRTLEQTPTELGWLEELKLPPDWDGAPARDVGAKIRAGRQRPEPEWWDGPPGGESFRDFRARVTGGMEALLTERGFERKDEHRWVGESRSDHRLLFVAHAGTNSVLVSNLLGLAPKPWVWEQFSSMHTSVTRLRAQELMGSVVFSLRVFSDVSHLEKNMRSR